MNGEIVENMKLEAILPTPIMMYKIVGLWRPLNWNSQKKYIYQIYTIFSVCMVFSVCMTEIVHIYFIIEKFTDILDADICMVATRFNVWVRMTAILLKRREIIELLKACVADRWRKVKDESEAAIHLKFKRKIRAITVNLICVASFFTFVLLIRKGVDEKTEDTPQLELPISAWYPWDLQVPKNFWIAYTHQAIGITPIVFGYISDACLISGFMVQICLQLEILKGRILKIPDLVDCQRKLDSTSASVHAFEKKLIIACIQDHRSILRLASHFNDTFSWVQFGLFFLTMLVICTGVYQLSQVSMRSISFIMVLNFCLMSLGHVFIFCWYGNEIILTSLSLSDVIFEMHWPNLDLNSKRLFLMMMTCVSKPIRISGGPIVTWDIYCFLNIIKASYSAFNVLQRAQA